MQEAIAEVWKKNRPVVAERLELLQRAAEDLSTSRTIDDDQRAEALSIAHKFAGSFGMFGLNEATEIARAIEATLEHDGLPQPERLQEQVDALTATLSPHLNA